MIMKLKKEARSHGGYRASEKKKTNYEAPHYVVLAPCSQTPSVYVPPLMSETKY
jgi:hypothetical protein